MADCSTGVCGTGDGNFPQPGDPNTDIVISARGVFGGIMVTWTYPDINSQAVAHFDLYRSTNIDPLTAQKIRTVTGDQYFDQDNETATSITYYYWIRVISVNGTVGDLVGPASAALAPTIGQMITMLTGQITSGVLDQSLRSEIGNILNVSDALGDETTNREQEDSLLSLALQQAQTDLNAVDTLLQSEITQRAADDSAIVAQVDLILAKSDSNAAAILTEQQVRADADSALAQSVTTLQSSVDGNSSSIQSVLQVQDGLTAQYMLKTDVNGYISGFGLYNDGATSQFIVRADTLALGNPGAGQVYPFIIDGTDVYIDTALIDNATITSAMIESVVASKISAGTITASVTMNAAHINGGSLNINNKAQIDAAGNATFQNATVRGDVEATSLKANIAMVETLHIKGQAVTIPISVYSSAVVSLGSTWKSLGEVSFTSTGAPVKVSFSADVEPTDFAEARNLRVLVNGVVAFTTGARCFGAYTNGPSILVSSIGEHLEHFISSGGGGLMTIRIEGKKDSSAGTGGGDIRRKLLTCTEMKR